MLIEQEWIFKFLKIKNIILICTKKKHENMFFTPLKLVKYINKLSYDIVFS